MGVCARVTDGCGLASGCLFDTVEQCESSCSGESHVESGCENSQNGCCPDKVTFRKNDGSCNSKSPLLAVHVHTIGHVTNRVQVVCALITVSVVSVNILPCFCVCAGVETNSVSKDTHGEVISPRSSGKAGGVRWDMVAIGAGVIVLLIVVLGLSGVVTYAYRNSHKNKERR